MTIKIIGAGFPRTGTMSMKKALETLGFSKTYHYKDLIATPERLIFWEQLENEGTTNFEKLFEGFQATVDFPGYPYYQQLLKKYPTAKVILTTRPFEDWYTSTYQTIWQRKLSAEKNATPQTRIAGLPPTKEDCIQFMRKVFLHKQFDGKFENKAHAANVFHRHQEQVKATVPKDQLLIFNVAEGWSPLCEFLGVDVPNTMFPHLNKKEDFHAMVDKMLVTQKAVVS